MTGKTLLLLFLAVSLSSCVPLAILGAGVAVGFVADEGLKYEPSTEGGGESYDPPANADDVNMPVY